MDALLILLYVMSNYTWTVVEIPKNGLKGKRWEMVWMDDGAW